MSLRKFILIYFPISKYYSILKNMLKFILCCMKIRLSPKYMVIYVFYVTVLGSDPASDP